MSASTGRGSIPKVVRVVALSLATGLVLLGSGGAAWAEPPPWAPAHGHRTKHVHHHYYRELAHVHEDHYHEHHYHEHHYHEHHYHVHEHVHKHVHKDVVVERPRYHHKPNVVYYRDRAALGGLVGAAAGGLLGAQVGDGRDQLAATAAGSVFGYIIGRELGTYHGPHRHY